MLADLNEIREVGIIDPLHIEKFNDVNNQITEKFEAVTKIEEALAKYTNGIDGYVARQILSKIQAFKKSESVTHKDVTEMLESNSDFSPINDKNKNYIPTKIKELFNIDPSQYNEADILKILDDITTKDTTS